MIWILLIVYQIKHFLADYPLQTPYMLGKFKPGWAFVGPLAAHCAVHAAFTFAIAFAVLNKQGYGFLFPFGVGACSTFLALFDFTIHFLMDRIKASPRLLGRFKALSAKEYVSIASYIPTLGMEGVKERFGKELKSNVYFWWALGLDQGVHHLTHYAIIYMLLCSPHFNLMGV